MNKISEHCPEDAGFFTSLSLCNLVFQAFEISDYISPIIHELTEKKIHQRCVWRNFNPNKTGDFEGRFFYGKGQFEPPQYPLPSQLHHLTVSPPSQHNFI